jgi:hypothetical protein
MTAALAFGDSAAEVFCSKTFCCFDVSMRTASEKVKFNSSDNKSVHGKKAAHTHSRTEQRCDMR